MMLCSSCYHRIYVAAQYQRLGIETANCIVCNWPFVRQARLKPRLYCSSRCDSRDRRGWPLVDSPDVVLAERREAAQPFGSRNEEIVRLHDAGNRTLQSLSDQFCVTHQRISQIIARAKRELLDDRRIEEKLNEV